MSTTANPATHSSTSETTHAIREPQSPTTERTVMNANASINNPVPNEGTRENQIPMSKNAAIPVDDDMMSESILPVGVNLARQKTVLWLDGESPFAREEWLNILSEPQVTIPEDSTPTEPFFYDFDFFVFNDKDVFHRPAQASELSTDFWQWKKARKLDVRAVVVRRPRCSVHTYFVSLPGEMPLAEGIKYLRVHAATEDIIHNWPSDDWDPRSQQSSNPE